MGCLAFGLLAVSSPAVALAAPTIAKVEPDHGPTSGGTRVIIHGEPLENARSVHFGSVEGRIIEEECGGYCEIVPYRTLVVESPPHQAGTVDVTVETAQGVSSTGPADQFTYSPPAEGPPSEVVTEPAAATPTGYELKGKLNPGGLPTTYYFEYIGDDQNECLGVENCWPQTAHMGPITGDTQQRVPSIEVTGLAPGETYRYRLAASNADGTVRSKDASFTVGSPPAIDSESVSNLTEHDATLQARIDTEGLETSYQFQLSSICGGKGACLVVINYPLPSGVLLGSFADQSVSLDLNSAGVTLQPGGTYTYSVSATNASGTTESPPHSFTTPEDAAQPLSTSTTTSPTSGAVQLVGPNSGDLSAGPEGSSVSSASGVQAPGLQVGETPRLESPTNAQKLAKALKACEKKPKHQRAKCERQAHEKYAAR